MLINRHQSQFAKFYNAKLSLELHVMIYNNNNKNWFERCSRLSLNSKFIFALSYCLRFCLWNCQSYLSLSVPSSNSFSLTASSLVCYTCMLMSLSVYILVRISLFIFPFVFTLMSMIEKVVFRCNFYLDCQTYLATQSMG